MELMLAILLATSATARDTAIRFPCEQEAEVRARSTPHPTAMMAVVATPKSFDGKLVSFAGVLRFQLDKLALFPSKELAQIEDMPSAVTSAVPACVTEEQFAQLDALDGHFVRVSGVFDSQAPGYSGIAAGSLVKIYEVTPAEPPRR